MIYFISDIHEDLNFSGLTEYIKLATDKDLLIILGDIGLNFQNTEENRKFTERFLQVDKNVAFIDGNHENFDYLNSFPVEDWNGGKVNRLSKNVVRLIRGNVYQIDGFKFFIFGGCKSAPKWKELGLWHDGEEPTKDEYDFALSSLEKHGNSVDFVLTHKYEIKGQGTNSELLLDLCNYIDKNVSYRKWLSGHWHREYHLDDKHYYVYNNLIKLSQI